jgi:hypothetical protein
VADTVRGTAIRPSHWYDDDKMLGYTDSLRLVRVQLAPRLTVDTIPSEVSQQRAVLSSDHRLVAFMSVDEVVVETFPQRRGRSIVARGLDPVWLDARTLVYRSGRMWYQARVNDDASLAAPPQPWFSDSLFIDTDSRSYTVTPSGEIVYLQSVAKATSAYLRVIPQWTARVEAAVEAALRR